MKNIFIRLSLIGSYNKKDSGLEKNVILKAI